MGWSYGFENGREVGYSVEATCDYDGCDVEIHRGLAYKCERRGVWNLILADGTTIEYPKSQELPEFTSEEYVEYEGCGLFFCSKHLYNHPHWFRLHREDEDE